MAQTASDIVVFLGPTLAVEDARQVLEADYRPPASRGDVLRAVAGRPRAIAIIDGYFDQVASIWHKEFLWAIKQGIRVYGSSSMGALRATELAMFGMVGIGKIFAEFEAGRLEDDDEVAIVHAPEEYGYVASSVAMVDLRFTLEAATAEGIVTARTADLLLAQIKSLHYPQRDERRLIALGRQHPDVPSEELDALEAWLPEGRVEQKKEDALELLRTLEALRRDDPSPADHSFTFQYTEAFSQLLLQLRGEPIRGGAPSSPGAPSWLDELRLEGAERYLVEKGLAHARLLSLELAAHRSVDSVDEQGDEERLARFCAARSLTDPEALSRWMESQQLEFQDLVGLLDETAILERIQLLFGTGLESQWRRHAQATGTFGRWHRRSLSKQPLESELDPLPDPSDIEDLYRWYFDERLGREMPQDLEAYAASLDLSLERWTRLLHLERELCSREPS